MSISRENSIDIAKMIRIVGKPLGIKVHIGNGGTDYKLDEKILN